MRKTAALIMILLMGLALTFCSDQKAAPAAKDEKYKAWKMPDYMMENIQALLNAKVEAYRKYLKENVKGYADIPDNAVFDLQTGVFLRAEDVEKIQKRIEAEKAKSPASAPEVKK